ncbi:putative Ig domain-containing protein [Rugosimonospora africana]|uniref:Peptidase n=1 Tax=Rugosimonospora africana TaxID=556532 RepID=A0A8J3VV03_9ACTN|nr:putative Ig domain-containing protein [Rugosimonospora africana]GIH20127.1 peptidase [Rugosimonospora africana]
MSRTSVRSLATGATIALLAGVLSVTALSTPAQAAACTPAQLIGNAGFESGSTPWTATSGVIGASSGQSAHGGTRFAWLDGYGSTHTDTLAQTVTLPADCTTATLTYWLHIDTAETTTTTAYDTLTVQVGTTTVASYSNLNKATGYQQRTVDVSGFAGQTVTLKYTGTEDSGAQTSFVLDDVALNVSGGGTTGQNPVVTNPGAQSSTVGTAVNLHIAATDPQGDALTYSATGLPAGLSINASTGVVSGTPTTASTGSVTVTATDTGSNTGSATFTWTVSPAGADATRTPGRASYTLNLTSNASGGTWTGQETIGFTNLSPSPLPEVYLRLWDNYHGTCPSNQPIQISGVTGGTLGSLEVNCTAVKITLPSPLAQNQSGTVRFTVSIAVPAGSDRFGSDGAYNFIGNAIPVLAVRDGAGWHLSPYTNNGESFYQLASDYTVTLDHPTSVLTPTTGRATETPGASGRTITTATATSVREFAWCAGPFVKTTTTTSSGVVFNTWRTSSISATTAASMQSTGASAMVGHASRFGAYPYGEIDLILHNNFWFGGMEYPGLVLSQPSATPVIHELGHQWFYGIVGDDEYTTPWLDEGFTDYATDLQQGITGTNCWANVRFSTGENITNSMAYWDAHSSRYSTVVYTYGKCALHDLRRLIGDSTMSSLLSSYAASHWYGISTVADFKAAAQAATSVDLTSFWSTHHIVG